MQIILNNLWQAQVQTTFNLEVLNGLDDTTLDIGRPCSVPNEWRPNALGLEQLVEEEQNEEGLVEEQGSYTVVRVDEDSSLRPSQTSARLSIDHMRMPRSSRIINCPRCSTGMECNNARCVGHTVQGYIWG